MKKCFFFVAAALASMSLSAQTLPEDVVALLPEGVTPVIEANLQLNKLNDLTVAGDSVKGYKAYFAAKDAEHGTELWVTDGTPEGTKMVKDILEGAESSEPMYITRFNDKVVFAANDGENGVEPWISDGTEDGTYMIADVHETAGSKARGFCQVNEDVFIFAAQDLDATTEYAEVYGWKPYWIFVSDGTEEGTIRLSEELDAIFPGKATVDAHNAPYVRVGRQVFFKANTINHTIGEELWVTDGTRKGTHLVMDINTEWADAKNPDAGTADNALNWLMNFYNEKLYFNAFSDNHSNECWASDGTAEGTYEIHNSGTNETTIVAADGSIRDSDGGLSYPAIGLGMVFNRGNVSANEYGNELYGTNCEKGDFHLICDAQRKTLNDNGKASGYPDVFCEFDGCMWFEAQTGTYADGGIEIEMHRYDGDTVIYPFGDFNPTGHGCIRRAYCVSGGSFYFTAAKQTSNMKVYRIDNKDQTEPTLVADISGSWETADQIHTFRNCGGTMLFCSGLTNQIYACNYKKEGYNPTIDNQQLEIEYRTRKQIEEGVDPHWRPEPEGLSSVKEFAPKAVKAVLNGQVYIISRGRVMNVLGQFVK